jgi:hypothetical protein
MRIEKGQDFEREQLPQSLKEQESESSNQVALLLRPTADKFSEEVERLLDRVVNLPSPRREEAFALGVLKIERELRCGKVAA